MEWIKVEDRLPEMIPHLCNSENVLAICVSHGRNTEYDPPNTYANGEKYISVDTLVRWSDTNQVSFRGDRYYGKVTHWMPLPEFPYD